MEDKTGDFERQLESVIQEATAQISALQTKCNSLFKDQEVTKKQSFDLHEQIAEKTRQFNKLQMAFEKIKRKNLVQGQQGQQYTSTPSRADERRGTQGFSRPQEQRGAFRQRSPPTTSSERHGNQHQLFTGILGGESKKFNARSTHTSRFEFGGGSGARGGLFGKSVSASPRF